MLVRQPLWRSTTSEWAVRKSTPRMGFFRSATSKSQVYLLPVNCKAIILDP